MSFFVENTGGGFTPCPAGTHLARCFRVIDLGTQETSYDNIKKFLHKIQIEWEVHGMDSDGKPLTTSDGRPYSINKEYTLSWAPQATLRLDLQSWRGKPFKEEELRRFDLKTILGVWCMVNAVEETSKKTGKKYAKVASISPVVEIIKRNGLPEPVNKEEIFMLQDPDMVIYESLTNYVKNKIQASPEWEKLQGKKTSTSEPVKKHEAPMMEDESFDDIPF
jgi:hypothetical protein